MKALLLERSGYTAKLFEFIATEHTPKNNMLVGTKTKSGAGIDKAAEQIQEVKKFYGIKEQRLETLLDSSGG